MRDEQESGFDDVFKRVLIAVDDSATSRWALGVGGALAARLGARVGLLHVVDLSKGFSPELAVLDERVMDQLRAAGAELLERDERSLPAGLTVVRLLRDGNPPGEIVAAADEWRADVVVLGAHARGAVARFLLGSTAEAVVRRAQCPVLTIGHQPSPRVQCPPAGTGEVPSGAAVGL
jgi:nucleotide-binding universal stress UspA family protein